MVFNNAYHLELKDRLTLGIYVPLTVQTWLHHNRNLKNWGGQRGDFSGLFDTIPYDLHPLRNRMEVIYSIDLGNNTQLSELADLLPLLNNAPQSVREDKPQLLEITIRDETPDDWAIGGSICPDLSSSVIHLLRNYDLVRFLQRLSSQWWNDVTSVTACHLDPEDFHFTAAENELWLRFHDDESGIAFLNGENKEMKLVQFNPKSPQAVWVALFQIALFSRDFWTEHFAS